MPQAATPKRSTVASCCWEVRERSENVGKTCEGCRGLQRWYKETQTTIGTFWPRPPTSGTTSLQKPYWYISATASQSEQQVFPSRMGGRLMHKRFRATAARQRKSCEKVSRTQPAQGAGSHRMYFGNIPSP
jgi:hypothetical protein